MNRYRVIAGPAHFAVGDVVGIDREHYLALVGQVAFVSRRDSDPRLIVRATAPIQFATGALIGLDAVPERLAAIVQLESPAMVASRQLDRTLADSIETLRPHAHRAAPSKVGAGAMSLELQSVGERLQKLRHSLDDRAKKFVQRMEATEARSETVFKQGHARLDADDASLAEVEKFLADLEGSNGGPTLGGSQESSGAADGTAKAETQSG